MTRIARLYLAAALERTAAGITAWRLAHGLLTAEEEAAADRAWRAALRTAVRPPADDDRLRMWWSRGGGA